MISDATRVIWLGREGAGVRAGSWPRREGRVFRYLAVGPVEVRWFDQSRYG